MFLDFDNDGDADLFLSGIGRQMLFENRLVPEGRLRFIDAVERLRDNPEAAGASVIAADVNRDGFTDIYVTSYGYEDSGLLPESLFHGTNGTRNLLLLNNGGESFTEVGESWGVADSRWSLAAQFVDIDQDGDPDLYVCNDYGGGNALYLNQGTHFVERSSELGLSFLGQSMGVSFADFDRDGDFDLYLTNMSSHAGVRIADQLNGLSAKDASLLAKQFAGNSLFVNLGDRFREATAEVGALKAGWGWGGEFVDFDNDGFEDLHCPNGMFSGSRIHDT